MTPFTFNSSICWQITLTLLHVSWIGLLIGLVAAALNHAMRNSAACRRYTVNFLSLLVLAASLPVALAIVRSGAEAIPGTVPMALNSIEEPAPLIPHAMETSSPVSPLASDVGIASDLSHASTLQPVHQWLAGAEASIARTSDSTTLPFRAGALSFSADSGRIAWTYGGGRCAAEVADVNTKKMVAHIPLPDAGVALDFSPDGTQLAIGNKDTTIGLWDLSKMAVVPADSDTKP